MDTIDRLLIKLRLELEWQDAREDYRTAGKPFGDGRGLEVWVEYGQWTTVN